MSRAHVTRPTLALAASCALVLSACGEDGAEGEDAAITEGVFFGDSLTDAGTYGYRFTTMPGLSWSQHIAEQLGQGTESNETLENEEDLYVGVPAEPGPGDLNYAQGGARANAPYSVVSDNPDGAPLSVNVQLDRFLEQHDSFDPDQLVTMWVGTNDVAYNYDPTINPEMSESLMNDVPVSEPKMDSELERVRGAAGDAADTVQRMLDNSAEQIMVFTLFDLAKAPWFESAASKDYVGKLAAAYNEELQDALPDDDRVAVFDTEEFIDDLVDNMDEYGFTYGANEDACTEQGVFVCEKDGWKSDDADQTYIFAGAEHLSTKTNELLAERVTEQVDEAFGK